MESMENVNSAPTKSKKLYYILGGLVALFLAATVYLYMEYKTLTSDPSVVNQQKIEAVVAKVEKLIDLPTGELPTLATVTDTAQLSGQPFFANAEVGDQVLLYTTAQKAYLYSPSKNVIVEVASLNIGQ
jgi:hypothetical protein